MFVRFSALLGRLCMGLGCGPQSSLPDALFSWQKGLNLLDTDGAASNLYESAMNSAEQ
jgi:hypothetical protein